MIDSKRLPHFGEIFLSSNAQDFIEDGKTNAVVVPAHGFLSSNAQDFIEDRATRRIMLY